jgi:hypothetical protein
VFRVTTRNWLQNAYNLQKMFIPIVKPTLAMLDRRMRHLAGTNCTAGSNCTLLAITLAKRGARLDDNDWAVYTTNMATPAANIATVVIATTVHPKGELGWPCISFLSEATTRIATRRKGANNPLMTAVQ